MNQLKPTESGEVCRASVPEEFAALIPEHGKSPWNPSRKATARVLNPLPTPGLHECGQPVLIAHHTQVYGREYSDWPWMYRCPACDASVGMHPFSNIPLGTLADRDLRALRKFCKLPFEQLWGSGRMTRSHAYGLLAGHLGIPIEECHFGWFNSETCTRAHEWAEAELRSKGKRSDSSKGTRRRT